MFSKSDQYFANTHQNFYEYLNEISYDDLMELFVQIDEKASEYVLHHLEETAMDIMLKILCHKYQKCVDWEKEDPFEDFRPSI